MRRSSAAYVSRLAQPQPHAGSLAAPAFGPGGEMYTDSKGRAWMMVDVVDGVVGISDDAHAEYMAKDRAELMSKIEAKAKTSGYGTLALIGLGIVGGLWWFLHETKASSARTDRSETLKGEREYYVGEIADVDWKRAWHDDEDEVEIGHVAAAPSRKIESGLYARMIDQDNNVTAIYGPYKTRGEALDDLGLGAT